MDLEGIPLPSAEVRITRVFEFESGFDTQEWERDTRELMSKTSRIQRERFRIRAPKIAKSLRNVENSIYGSVHVGSNGQFALPDAGANRMLQIEVYSPGMATESIRVMPRTMEPIASNFQYYGNAFTWPVKPGRSVRGTIVDSQSNRPLPQVVVSAAGTKAVTNSTGSFEIDGLPRGKPIMFSAEPIDHQYFGSQGVLSSGTEDAVLSLSLRKGLLVRGMLVDGQSGEPIAGRVRYMTGSSNVGAQAADVFEKQVPSYRSASTGPDGSFEIAALPGNGYLDFYAKRKHWYRLGEGSELEPEVGRVRSFNKRLEIDVPATGVSETLKVELSRYPTHKLRFAIRADIPSLDF